MSELRTTSLNTLHSCIGNRPVNLLGGILDGVGDGFADERGGGEEAGLAGEGCSDGGRHDVFGLCGSLGERGSLWIYKGLLF